MGFFRVIATVCALGIGATRAPVELAAPTIGASQFRAPSSAAPRGNTCIPADQCCKVCSQGKACGNSCINQSYTCHKGRGCACNASEVCE